MRRALPRLWLMTDERLGEAALLRAVERLPRGSAIILRHYSLPLPARRALFERLRQRAKRRGLPLLFAGAARTAQLWGADGHHGPAAAGPIHRGRRRHWLHSAPAHTHRERRAAERVGADVILLSPLFATRSHPGARPLGPARFAALAREAHVPVIALGGVHRRHGALVHRLGAWGYAAIDGLMAHKHRDADGRSE